MCRSLDELTKDVVGWESICSDKTNLNEQQIIDIQALRREICKIKNQNKENKEFLERLILRLDKIKKY